MRSHLPLLLLGSTAACGGDLCAADELLEALEAARGRAGEVVRLGACAIPGGFTVPAGVELRGQGSSLSTIAGQGTPALVVEPGLAGPTRITGLEVTSPGPIALLSRGPGEVALADVAVSASLGIGLAADGLSRLELSHVGVEGPIGASQQGSVNDMNARPEQNATHGLVLLSVADAALSDVAVRGFARVGALLVTSTVSWTRGGVSDSVGTGLAISGGRATLGDVSLCRMSQGGLTTDSFGGVAVGGARLTSSRLAVCDNQHVGFFQETGAGAHTLVDVHNNGLGGFWAQRTAGLELQGRFADNGFAGVMLIETRQALLHDSELRAARMASLTDHQQMTRVSAADGVQLARTASTTELSNLMLVDNPRVGALFELAGAAVEANALRAVTVRVPAGGVARGVVAQNGVLGAGWDQGVTRVGVTQAEDLAAGAFPAVGIVGPCNLPRPEEGVRPFLAMWP